MVCLGVLLVERCQSHSLQNVRLLEVLLPLVVQKVIVEGIENPFELAFDYPVLNCNQTVEVEGVVVTV